MAEYVLRNALNPYKAVACTVTFRQLVNKGEEGEPVWVVEVGTAALDKSGNSIPPVFIHYTSAVNIDDAIRIATEKIGSQIDWSPSSIDKRPPFVTNFSPAEKIVSIYSDVVVNIEDLFPTAGIDPDSIQMTVNDLDVSEELKIKGNPFPYSITWGPKIRVLDTE
jgi:hypothetical protein